MSELLEKVEKAIDPIRPYLKADGGDVKVLSVDENGKVIVELLGSCGSCAMSPMTLKSGVLEAIQKEIPEITSIEAINLDNV